MAKKKKRKGHRKARRTKKQRAATRKMIAANRRRRRGGKRKASKRHNRKARRGSRKASVKRQAAATPIAGKKAMGDAYRRLIDRGATEAYARKVIARMERKRSHNISKGVAAEHAKHVAAQVKSHWGAFGDVFRKIGAEEQRRASL